MKERRLVLLSGDVALMVIVGDQVVTSFGGEQESELFLVEEFESCRTRVGW